MKRRDFIAGLGGMAALPLAARAQQTPPVIGFLHGGSPAVSPTVLALADEVIE